MSTEIRWCGEQYPDWYADAMGRVYRGGTEVVPRSGAYPRVTYNRQRVHVHTLVCTAFYGPRPEGLECRHLNDVRTDNRAINLCWGTPSENRFDAVRNGLHHPSRGEKHGRAKLSAEDVHAIRCAYAEGGITQAQLALSYGVARPAISRIVRGKRWGHLADQTGPQAANF